MTTQVSSRDPYPYPTYENDCTFVKDQQAEKYRSQVPTHIAQTEDPWNRLNRTATLSSVRHEARHYDPQAPRDSLDFVIKSMYDQHGDFLKGKAETLVQAETATDDHGRILKNRVVEVPTVPPPLNHPLRVSEQKEKRTLNQAKGAIEGHHSETTNRGYSRKPDGGYFTI